MLSKVGQEHNVLGCLSACELQEIINFLGEDIGAGFGQGFIRVSGGCA
jgi:hypothetical protein